MFDRDRIFLSYSRNDPEAAASLRAQLEKGGLSVFKDDATIREGDQWLTALQEAVDGCTGFVVLVGRDGVGRWIGAETQVALIRYFGPKDDVKRLPIFPILLGEVRPESLPAFLRLFQATLWNGRDPLPNSLLDQIRARTILTNEAAVFDGCPFVGLDAFRMDQARLFFGRQKETLDALACFDTRRGSAAVRWLEINGNSGSGKSSLMNAGLLPLVDQGWLWPRTRIEHWRLIGPLMPGEHPVNMLAESLARFSRDVLNEPLEMANVRPLLEAGDRGLADWLRGRKQEDTAFLLAVDQFEELFTVADPGERRRLDGLLAAALVDADCPLFLISTMRADFLDRLEDLPRLVNLRDRLGKAWTLPPIGEDGLREVIGGPARLAGLNVSEVQEAMVAEATDEPGALPLVENALFWLCNKRAPEGRLSGREYTEQGGLAGILRRSADDLLAGLGKKQYERALELLFRLVKVDPEGRRHTRQRIPRDEAIAIAGGGESGLALVNRLSGARDRNGVKAPGQLLLITVTEEAVARDSVDGGAPEASGAWVNLIHETLIHSKLNDEGKPQPYWPTLWNYIEDNKDRAERCEELRFKVRRWKERRGFARLIGLAGWSGLFGFRGLAAPESIELRYLRWSAASVFVQSLILAGVLGLVGESVYWAKIAHNLPLEAIGTRWTHKLGKLLPFPDLVKVPAGSFKMGSESGLDDELPVHQVTIAKPFYLAETEVTFAEYDAFCESTGRDRPSDEGWPERTKRPAINVDWKDASAYAGWLDAMTGVPCRLPSEAEWEYAARAGTETEYALPRPGGSDVIAGEKVLANCADCGSEWSGRQTAPVRSFEPNGWRLFDMHGNVWEWVADCWHKQYKAAPADGGEWRMQNGGDCYIGVLRGGSWHEKKNGARSANRFSFFPGGRGNDIGFRVLCSSPIVDH